MHRKSSIYLEHPAYGWEVAAPFLAKLGVQSGMGGGIGAFSLYCITSLAKSWEFNPSIPRNVYVMQWELVV